MSEEREFNFKGYWGADILRPFVEHSKKGVHYCIYCGAIADTREHVPSKAFLNKPLPSDLPTLPAFRTCNNGFSGDELYTNTYIECVKSTVSLFLFFRRHHSPGNKSDKLRGFGGSAPAMPKL